MAAIYSLAQAALQKLFKKHQDDTNAIIHEASSASDTTESGFTFF